MELSVTGLVIPGAIAALIACLAWWRDHRRHHRSDPDAVGFIDWTTLFFLALLPAVLLLSGAARLWLAG